MEKDHSEDTTDSFESEVGIRDGWSENAPQTLPLDDSQESSVSEGDFPKVETVQDESADIGALNASTELVLVPPPESKALVIPLASPSRLKFAAEEKSVATQLQGVEEKALRRKKKLRLEMHKISKRIAKVAADLAEERLARTESLRLVSQYDVIAPLHQMLNDLTLQRDQSSLDESSELHWRNLTRRIEDLDTEMTVALHKDLPEMRSKHSTEYDVERCEVEAQLALHKSDKRERLLATRMDQLAGTLTRRLHEEIATCKAEFTLLDEQMDKLSTDKRDEVDSKTPQIAQELIQQIRDLRGAVKHERALRQSRDEYLRKLIDQRMETMKAAILEVHGD